VKAAHEMLAKSTPELSKFCEYVDLLCLLRSDMANLRPFNLFLMPLDLLANCRNIAFTTILLRVSKSVHISSQKDLNMAYYK